MKHPVTPDGRYFVVRGRLWRLANPASRGRPSGTADAGPDGGAPCGAGRARGDGAARPSGPRAADVDAAKRALGERGPAWWQDGAPDLNRRLARNTPYAAWFASLPPEPDEPGVLTAGGAALRWSGRSLHWRRHDWTRT